MNDSLVSLLGLYFVLSFLSLRSPDGSLASLKNLLKDSLMLLVSSFLLVNLSHGVAGFAGAFLKHDFCMAVLILGGSASMSAVLKKEVTFMVTLMTFCFLYFEKPETSWLLATGSLLFWAIGYGFFRFIFVGFKERLLFASPAKSFEGLPFYLLSWVYGFLSFSRLAKLF